MVAKEFEDLWGHVSLSANKVDESLLFGVQVGAEAKISNLDYRVAIVCTHLFIQQNIFKFYVTMDDVHSVQELKPFKQLNDNFGNHGFREKFRALLNSTIKRASEHQLLHDEDSLFVLKHIDHLDTVHVTDILHNQELILQPV